MEVALSGMSLVETGENNNLVDVGVSVVSDASVVAAERNWINPKPVISPPVPLSAKTAPQQLGTLDNDRGILLGFQDH